MAAQQQQQNVAIITCPNPPVAHLERHGYLFGYPIAHSMSSLLHQTIFDGLGLRWGQLFLPSTDMHQFLALVRDAKLYGSAVTMPHKVAILPHLDDLTDDCRAVGACNTVFRRGDQLVGANTDTVGIARSFAANVAAPDALFRGRPSLVIGGGGAARSAVYALVRLMGCRTVYLVNRDAGEVAAVMEWCAAQGYGDGLVHVESAAQATGLEAVGAIVACIPNVPPVTAAECEVRRVAEVFLTKSQGALLEMCYHPTPWTELAALATDAGWQVILGHEVMIHQGIQQHLYWHGSVIDEALIRKVTEVIARELSTPKIES